MGFFKKFFKAVLQIAAVALAVYTGGIATTILGAIAWGTAIYAATELLAPDVPKFDFEAASAERGSLLNNEGSSRPIPVVYGERRVGGTRIFMASNGDKNKYLHIVLTLCEGPIQGVDAIYLNDELAATSTNGGTTWSYVSKYSGKMRIIPHLGDQTTADATLVAENVGWTNTQVGYGVAYLYIRLTFDQEAFASGLPVITAKIRGKKVPTIGSEWNQNLTYSSNPANVIYDYLVNTNYGKGITPDLIDLSSFTSAEAYCAQTVTNLDASTETRYIANARLDVDYRMFDNIVDLLQTCRGFITTTDKYQLQLDRPVDTTSVAVIDDDNIIGDIEFTPGSKRTLRNSARVKFNNESAAFNYQEDFHIIDSPELQAADGVKLTLEFVLAHTTSKTMVERITIENINQSRQSGVVKVETTTQLFNTSVGDVVKFSNSTLGQYDKLYRVVNQVLTADHRMELLLVEYDPLTYWDNNTSIILNNKDDTEH